MEFKWFTKISNFYGLIRSCSQWKPRSTLRRLRLWIHTAQTKYEDRKISESQADISNEEMKQIYFVAETEAIKRDEITYRVKTNNPLFQTSRNCDRNFLQKTWTPLKCISYEFTAQHLRIGTSHDAKQCKYVHKLTNYQIAHLPV